MADDDAHDRTVDADELARYRALADMWWQPDGKLWPLHVLNRLRTGYIRDHLCERYGRDPAGPAPLAGLRMLDIGCGGGLLSEAMAGLGASVHGVDVSDSNIQVARLHAREQGLAITYETATAEALAGRGARYDVVLNMEVVEHVADLPAFMAAVNRLISPGGHTFVATINRNAVSFVVAILGAEYIFRLLPRGTHQWSRFPTPGEMETLLERDGITTVRRTGVKVNPLTRRMWLSPSESVNYMLLARRQAEGEI
ncbi:bifunctional 2-polyprenyl-6-hydroxyphenol methylase/3-demethylubiquinol 3-O-methyltransferase UbiG [Aquisalimonas asiatica]|uniref:Ubiquinone biosynthesis O-methyltransferase n=1 Tax=Aquisalimonas asiatica TaxID=406100 RepID=A0A1H8U9K6_9GAMM|nr:bifunctional 2-polyprenyl-6-hydroxyphenol methylase/3-demethylubiquinol 3-O-methyltransferase UbiG [Aquisalimonas asiatica]SEO99855.1 3-demethylubiquinone-9 3-methyltransferase [Aquisalimonas asiatica]